MNSNKQIQVKMNLIVSLNICRARGEMSRRDLTFINEEWEDVAPSSLPLASSRHKNPYSFLRGILLEIWCLPNTL